MTAAGRLRTARLAAAVARQLGPRGDRSRLEAELLAKTSQLTELTQHLQNAREDERLRLARDLHDDLGALLTSAKLDAARIRSRLAGSAPEALERLAHLVGMLDAGIALKRRIIENLRPSSLDALGLIETLNIVVRQFAESSGLVMHVAFEPVPLAPAAELVVYRIVQEALTNIAKHARATRVWFTLAAQGPEVRVSVRDDGIGFDNATPPRSAYGLMGMRYRVEAEGGTLSVNSSPGRGTHLRVTMPAMA